MKSRGEEASKLAFDALFQPPGADTLPTQPDPTV